MWCDTASSSGPDPGGWGYIPQAVAQILGDGDISPPIFDKGGWPM